MASVTKTKKAVEKPAAKKRVCTYCGCEEEEPTEWVISQYEVQYFRDHLESALQKEFDETEAKLDRAAAFGYMLQKVLSDTMPHLRVDLPDQRLTVMPRAS
jgi:hypothetical protein